MSTQEQVITQQPSAPPRIEPAQPQRGTGKQVLLWVSGVTPTRLVVGEIRASMSIAWWGVTNLFKSFNFNRAEAKEDAARAKAGPEKFWDDIVISAKITERSLRSRYRMALLGCYAMLFAIAASIGVLAAYQGVLAITVGNAVLINILLISYIANLHRLYTARAQRVITILSFLWLALKQPGLLLPIELPENYKLRTSPASTKEQ